MKKRGAGEGSVWEEKPGRWIAMVSLGWKVEDGKRKRLRKKLVGKTRAEVRRKLNSVLSRQDRGLPPSDTRMSFGTFFASWLRTVSA